MPQGTSDEDLLELARQLLVDPSAIENQVFRDVYITELNNHLSLTPNATNFKLQPQPSVAFCKVICLMPGCNQEIRLHRNVNAFHGGKPIGFGSLSQYRAHLSTHHPSPDPDEPQPGPSRNANPMTPVRRLPANATARTSAQHDSNPSPPPQSSPPLSASPSPRPFTPRREMFHPDAPNHGDLRISLPPQKRPSRARRSSPAKRPRLGPLTPTRPVPLPAYITPPRPSGSNVTLEQLNREEHYMDVDDDDDEDALPLLTPTQIAQYRQRGWRSLRGRDAQIAARIFRVGDEERLNGPESVAEALRQLRLESIDDLLPGMKVALLPHQVIGVAWMLSRELARTKAKGGICADMAGLGKTVQMLALMLMNMPDPRRPTLIIVPPSLLEQWQAEIYSKTNMEWSIYVYHGKNKTKDPEELQQYDIVLTTYRTMSIEWFDPEKRVGHGEPDAPRLELFGPLSRIDWYRIVLDEAQFIRNKETRMSRAAHALKAKHRWCLTGTPIMNTLADAWGLLRFLRATPKGCDWDTFRRFVVKSEKNDPEFSAKLVRQQFKLVLIRRRKDTQLQGEPIMQLFGKAIEIERLRSTPEEREIYDMLEERAQAVFNRYFKAGTVLKNYMNILVAILRLRQVCSHPALMVEGNLAFTYPDEGADTSQRNQLLTLASQTVERAFVDALLKKYMAMAVASKRADEAAARRHNVDSAQAEPNQSPSPTDGEAETEAEAAETICSICTEALATPVVTACKHVFCLFCIDTYIDLKNNEAMLLNPDVSRVEAADCPTCGEPVRKSHHFPRWIFWPTAAELAQEQNFWNTLPGAQNLRTADVIDTEQGDEDRMDEDEDDAPGPAPPRSRHAHRATRRIIMDDDDDMDSEVIHGAKPDNGADIAEGPHQKKFLPSTKMKYMMDLIVSWQTAAPDEKIIIISQWTQCLQLVSQYLTEHGFLHVKYQGDMNQRQRSHSIKVFMEKPQPSIMLMSLKAGGVGLNLTRANRIINLDLSWNLAVEDQAYDRVHRLGQTRPVLIKRLVIENTIEERILALQERKQALANGALGDVEHSPPAPDDDDDAVPRRQRGGGPGPALAMFANGSLSIQDFQYLVNVDSEGRSLTHTSRS